MDSIMGCCVSTEDLMTSTPSQLGFFDLTTRNEALSRQADPLEQLAQVVPWETFRLALAKVLRRSKRTKGGRPPFDAICMVKVLVLQAPYNLSDDQTEYQIRDRLSFMRFLGLDLAQRIPDAKTIWLFRETLAQAGVVEALFEQFNAYLADQGLHPRGGQLIDASLVPVPKQRNTREENAALKAGQSPTEWKADPAKRQQKNLDARWTVKHGDHHYGYQNHVNVDNQHKLIRPYTVTNAAVPDSQALETVLHPESAGEVYGRIQRIAPRRRKRYSRGNTSIPTFKKKAIGTSPGRRSKKRGTGVERGREFASGMSSATKLRRWAGSSFERLG
jgi:transposase, IS5 family